jgi:membrane protein
LWTGPAAIRLVEGYLLRPVGREDEILAIAIGALVFDRFTGQTLLLGQAESMIGSQGFAVVKEMIEHAQQPASGTLASIIGEGTSLFGASGVFGELRSALDTPQYWVIG